LSQALFCAAVMCGVLSDGSTPGIVETGTGTTGRLADGEDTACGRAPLWELTRAVKPTTPTAATAVPTAAALVTAGASARIPTSP
jgi:hypothetical protein